MSEDSPLPPSSPLPSFDDEVTGMHEVPRPMRPWAGSMSRRMRKTEKQVGEVHSDWSAIKKFFGVFRWLAPMLASVAVAAIVAVLWLVNHAATQPQPPSAQDIAREIAKQQH